MQKLRLSPKGQACTRSPPPHLLLVCRGGGRQGVFDREGKEAVRILCIYEQAKASPSVEVKPERYPKSGSQCVRRLVPGSLARFDGAPGCRGAHIGNC